MNRRLMTTLAALLVVASSLTVTATDARASDNKHARSAREMSLRQDMRKLWEDHITWTRVFIISAVGGMPDKDAATQRLLQNQVDIGNAIKPFFGDAAGDKLTSLLKDHILIAADVVTYAKANDTARLADAKARWVANADDIAMFLHNANPKAWSLEAMKRMMHEHLDLTTNEAVARIQGNWSADVQAYDRVHTQILQMADMLSEGIVGQFPKQFS